MAITQLVKTYNNYDIYLRKPGFEFTPIIAGKIASFVVQEKAQNGKIAVFAFAYSMLDAMQQTDINEDDLLNKAVSIIESKIDEGTIDNRGEYPFDYIQGSFIYNSSAQWWVKTP